MAPGGRRRRLKKTMTFHVSVFNAMPLPCGRDWAELPKDVLLHIFHKVEDQVELLLGGVAGVCRSWRSAARGEPELWRHIDMRGQFVPNIGEDVSLEMLTQDALRLSAGQCESFAATEDVNDDLLLFLVEQAPLLKSLRLIACYNVSNEIFGEAIYRFPLLEELEVSYCYRIDHDTRFLRLVAKACPRIKHLKYSKAKYICEEGHTSDGETLGIAEMPNLRSLELSSDTVRNEDLSNILNKCPRLDYLTTEDCFLINMDDNLRKKCAQIKTDDYQHFRQNKPFRCRSKKPLWGSTHIGNYDAAASKFHYLGGHVSDSDDELEEQMRLLDIKTMRRYVR